MAAKAWEKFFQPLKDLADLWSLDIEKDLNAYLDDLDKAAVASNGQHINFAEAAVLVQNSAQYYSKKVEQLGILAYTVLERITESKRREVQGGQASGTDHEGQDLNVFDADVLQDLLSTITSGQLHLMHDFFQMNDGTFRRPSRNVLSTCDCMPFEDFEKSEKNYRMQVAELSDRCCLLVNPDSAFLISNHPSSSSMVSLDVSRIPAGSQMHSLDSSDGFRAVHQELGQLLVEKEEEEASIPDSNDDVGAGNNDDDGEMLNVEMPDFDCDSQPGQVVPDPLSLDVGDPYDTSKNIVQPRVKGNHEKRVKLDAMPHMPSKFLEGIPDIALQNGFLLTAQFPNNEPVHGRKQPLPSGLEDARKEVLKKWRQQIREINERNRTEAQQLQHLFPADVDPHPNAASADDVDVDDGGFDDFDEPRLADGDASFADLPSPSQSDRWVEEAVQQMSQYQQLSEEEVAVHERVSNWTRRIEPILNMQEQEEHEKPFKLYHYADSIMQHFKRSKVVNFADVVVPDAFTDDRRIHISRTFLACLQLANNGNVDLQHKPGLVTTADPLLLRFIKAQQPNAFEDSSTPITDISNVPRSTAQSSSRSPEERPAKRKKT